MNPQAQLLGEKVTRELFRIAQAHGLQHPFAFDDLSHDLAVMVGQHALQSVSLKFFRPGQQTVLAEYTYAIHPDQRELRADHAQGLAIVPLTGAYEMRLVVNRDWQGGAYASQLRLNWGPAPDLRRHTGYAEQDGNTTSRTGGRASKVVFIDDSLRRGGRIKWFARPRQYGFIVAADGAELFFHASNLAGFEPQPGQPVTFLPVVTPKGVQAKDIRPA